MERVSLSLSLSLSLIGHTFDRHARSFHAAGIGASLPSVLFLAHTLSLSLSLSLSFDDENGLINDNSFVMAVAGVRFGAVSFSIFATGQSVFCFYSPPITCAAYGTHP